MTTTVRILIATLAFAIGTAMAARPDFTGEWKMNTAKSDFGPAPAPSSRTDKIVHKGSSLKITRSQVMQAGSGTAELNCTTDGKDCDVSLTGAAIKFTGAFKWVDDVLTFDAKGAYNGGDLTIHERWGLSPDGKAITIQRHLTVSEGEVDQTIVLEK
jgi:hypothetical protein